MMYGDILSLQLAAETRRGSLEPRKMSEDKKSKILLEPYEVKMLLEEEKVTKAFEVF